MLQAASIRTITMTIKHLIAIGHIYIADDREVEGVSQIKIKMAV